MKIKVMQQHADDVSKRIHTTKFEGENGIFPVKPSGTLRLLNAPCGSTRGVYASYKDGIDARVKVMVGVLVEWED